MTLGHFSEFSLVSRVTIAAVLFGGMCGERSCFAARLATSAAKFFLGRGDVELLYLN